MKRVSRTTILLILILIVAAFLRLWHLGSVPPSLTWDEASLGYNAYSILKTGRDEYGQLLPINLKSFGDYKPAVYAYLDIPFVAVFGLNEVAVRLPSALFGVLSVLAIYLLVKELFGDDKLGLSIALMLAISPLALQFSRPAFEANIAFGLNLWGVLFFLRGLKKSPYYLASVAVFGLSLFTYQSSRLFVPVILVVLLTICRRQIIFNRNFKISLVAWIILIVVTIGVVVGLGQSSRLATLNVFSYPRKSEEVIQISKEDGWVEESWQFQLLHGEWWAYARGLTQRYLLYFSPKTLFVDGDVSFRNRVPDLGTLYYFSVVLVPVGLWWLLRQSGWRRFVIIAYLLLAPLPAILARDLINIIRADNLLLPLCVMEGAGLYVTLNWLRRLKLIGRLALVSVVVVMAVNMVIYLDRYFVHAPIEYSEGWVYGYKQLFAYLDTLDLTKYSTIAMTDRLGQPYIYYLFYHQYPPAQFQRQAKLDQSSVDVGTVRVIDKYQFRWIDRWADRNLHNALLISTADELKDEEIAKEPTWKLFKDIKYLDGQIAFRVVESH